MAPGETAESLDGATFVRLTDFPGTEFDADISPNGDFVAYGSDRDGTFDLWVDQIDGGEPENLTSGQFSNVHYPGIRNLGFSANGSHVWFHGPPNVRVIAAPKTGGAFEPLLGPEVVNMDWTRDGSRVVYHTAEPGDPIYMRLLDGPAGDPISLEPPGVHQHFPVWSFNEDWIFFVRGTPATRDLHLWRMRPDGSEAEQLTREQMFVAFPTPIDENTVLFVAQDAEGSGPWLWSLDLPSRSTQRVSVGTEQYTSLAASQDGRRIVATVATPKATLWRVPIGESIAKETEAGPLPGVPSLRALAPQYGGGELFYLSSRGAGDGLWMLRGGRARRIWSGAKEPLLFLPSISPDGTLAALVRRQGPRMVMFTLSVESRQIVRALDRTLDVRGGSSWSPGGDWIVTGAIGPDGPGLFKLPSGGGPAQQIASGNATDPVWSPTDDLIVYGGEQEGPMQPLRAIRSDGTPVELSREVLEVRVHHAWIRFLRDGSGLVYLSGASASRDFWHLDLATGKTRQLTALDQLGAIRTFDVTPDGQAIVFDRAQQNSDIVLIELPKRGPGR